MSEDEAIEIMLDNKKEYERIIKELDDVKDTNGNKPNETIQDCQKIVQAIETILDELEKKDKIIDAMAKEWFELDSLFMIRGKNIHSEKELKQYFERRAEDE